MQISAFVSSDAHDTAERIKYVAWLKMANKLTYDISPNVPDSLHSGSVRPPEEQVLRKHLPFLDH